MSPNVPTLRPFQVEDVAQRVRDHYRLHLRAVRSLQLRHVDLIRRQRDVDEDGNQSVLEDRIHRRGKSRRDGQHFIARLQLTCAQLGRGQCAQCNQICARSRVHQARRTHADKLRQPSLELLGKAPSREPPIQRRVHHRADVFRPYHLARNRNHRCPRHKLPRGKLCRMVLRRQLQNLPS